MIDDDMPTRGSSQASSPVASSASSSRAIAHSAVYAERRGEARLQGPSRDEQDPGSLEAKTPATPAMGLRVANRQPVMQPELSHLEQEPPRIALYEDVHNPPLVVSVAETRLPQLLDAMAARVHDLAAEQGGEVPYLVLRELVDNLVHASFRGVVVTILDRGNTIRISDRGPGIPDKDSALQPGFTSADASAKQYIRGVGSGFSLVREALREVDGSLSIEDNLGRGTVVTAQVSPSPQKVLASAPVPTYNLSERQLKTLLLTVELAPVGPTRIAEELGVSTSTAYRDLVALEDEGFVASRPSGHRVVTDAGLGYLDAVL